jgi:hypothetical protein
MLRVVFIFFFVFGLFYFGLDFFRKLTGREKWELIKLLSYSLACSLATILVLVSIVVLF